MEALHAQDMAQGRYVIYSSLGPTIKREVAKERFKTTSILDLWIAVRNCFYLRNESTVQSLRDSIIAWDIEKAGNWKLYGEGLERMYSRLDIVAGDRGYTPSDKLHKLRTVLSKMEGEKEKNISHQVE